MAVPATPQPYRTTTAVVAAWVVQDFSSLAISTICNTLPIGFFERESDLSSAQRRLCAGNNGDEPLPEQCPEKQTTVFVR